MLDNLNAPQPAPQPGCGHAIWDLVIADMRERDASGKAKYGRRLRARDGRDHLIDAYQEALDLAVYLRQEIEERRIAIAASSSVAQPEADTKDKEIERLRKLCREAKRLFLDELQLNPDTPKDMQLLGNGARACIREIDALSSGSPSVPETPAEKAMNEHELNRLAKIAEQFRASGSTAPVAETWKPIETAPQNGEFLALWPALKLDDDGNITDKPAKHAPFIGVTYSTNGVIEDPDALNATGEHFGDDWEFGPATHWMPIPDAPASPAQTEEK